ncbi:zinc-binding alcohol dehydrogenase family protein [Nakamurella silvestris]|nr:zinc-binding alcohol dehydrogenase family protein [Nakamurella silvestris]
MKAAVVTDLSRPPQYIDFVEPEPTPGYQQVRMLAAGVHQLVRSLAAGRHYGAADALPFVAGVDGIARLEDGSRAYVGGAPDPYGTLAERTIVPIGWSVPVPDGLDDATAAAIVNPATSSWLPLKYRAQLQPGGTVLVLGATGVSGRLAVQLAAQLGAGRIIAAGRNPAILAELRDHGATHVVDLRSDPENVVATIRAAAGEGIDVVLDYLWGPVAELALEALRVNGLSHHTGPTHYVQIGALAGNPISLDAGLLRSSNVIVSGSGAGSMNPAHLIAEIPHLLGLAAAGRIDIDMEVRPLSEVGQAWGSDRRLVFIP